MTLEFKLLPTLLNLDKDDPDFLKKALQYFVAIAQVEQLDAAKLKSLLVSLIAELDNKLSAQVSLILQHQSFQKLESRWHGLQSLVNVPYNKNRVKVRCLDLDWQHVSADLNLSAGLKHSQLYNKICNKELNTLGGEPFGLIVVDHMVSTELDDFSEFDELYTLELLAMLGEYCLCPFILSPAEGFFGEKGARWISDTQRVGKVTSGPDFTAWQNLRSKDSSRYLGLSFPQLKVRDAYQNYPCGFVFTEQDNARNGLWGGAHFAFASTVIREFNRINWFGFLKSRWNDRLQGAVINLPIEQHPWSYPQPKVRLFGKIAQFYAEQGFIPVCHSPLTEKYYFMDNRSVWQSSDKSDDKVLSLLQTTLICCRIAHYLKVQIREVLGSFYTASECEQLLSKWLSQYVSNVASGNDETLAKYPLRQASVKVRESAGNSGEFTCEVALQPQYQFDMFSGKVLLTTEISEAQ